MSSSKPTPLQHTLERSAFCRLIQRGELDVVVITHPAFRAEVLLQGAQMIAFAPTGESNWLWLSDTVEYKKGISLRGGIPICWPWFGNACKNPPEIQAHYCGDQPAPAHGFARTQIWQLTDLYEATDRVELCMTLSTTRSRQPSWPAETEVIARWVMRKDSLTVQLTTHNHGQSAIAVTQALHTYLPTPDIHQTRLSGLHHHSYLDTLDNWRRKSQSGDVHFHSETDRIYYTAPNAHRLTLITPDQRTLINASGSKSCIVWNPWIEKSRHLGQFEDTAWQRMTCVETANAADDWINIEPGNAHTLSVTFHQDR